ncbi:hypothetical protein LTR53_006590 [Teratosphaeriaceae sp. CCFEE 6253]|nr:hypothetical protein LTR53_006590 [Teratosphaeriaceae sp. CCFEE 6253]
MEEDCPSGSEGDGSGTLSDAGSTPIGGISSGPELNDEGYESDERRPSGSDHPPLDFEVLLAEIRAAPALHRAWLERTDPRHGAATSDDASCTMCSSSGQVLRTSGGRDSAVDFASSSTGTTDTSDRLDMGPEKGKRDESVGAKAPSRRKRRRSLAAALRTRDDGQRAAWRCIVIITCVNTLEGTRRAQTPRTGNMAEVVGLAASVIGVGAFAIQLAESVMKIKTFCERVKEAPRRLRHLAEEIEIMASLLTAVSGDHVLVDGANRALLERCVKLCREAVDELSSAAEGLLGSLGSRRYMSAVKTVLRRDHLDELVGRVERSRNLPDMAHRIYITAQSQRQLAELCNRMEAQSWMELLSSQPCPPRLT